MPIAPTFPACLPVCLSAVMLMSLRAQLQAPQGTTRPIIAAQLNTDNLHDASRCNVLLWVPRSNGSQFLAGHASGNIILYKKVRRECGPGRPTHHHTQQALLLRSCP